MNITKWRQRKVWLSIGSSLMFVLISPLSIGAEALKHSETIKKRDCNGPEKQMPRRFKTTVRYQNSDKLYLDYIGKDGRDKCTYYSPLKVTHQFNNGPAEVIDTGISADQSKNWIFNSPDNGSHRYCLEGSYETEFCTSDGLCSPKAGELKVCSFAEYLWLDAPPNFKVSHGNDPGEVTLGWGSVHGAESYSLSRLSPSPAMGWSKGVGELTHTLNNQPHGEYKFRIKACKELYCGPASEITFNVDRTPAKPGKPQHAGGNHHGDLPVEWTISNVANVDEIRLMMQKDGLQPVRVKTFSGSATNKFTVDFEDVMKGQKGRYRFYTSACNLVGGIETCNNSDWSDYVTIKLPIPDYPEFKGPRETTVIEDTYTLAWSAPSESKYVAHYLLKEEKGGVQTGDLRKVTGTSLVINDNVDGTYHYYLVACNADNECPAFSESVKKVVSKQADVAAPIAPVLSVNARYEEDFEVKWSHVNNAAYYLLDSRWTPGSQEPSGEWHSVTGFSEADQNLATSFQQVVPNEGNLWGVYSYRVTACNLKDECSPNTQVNVLFEPDLTSEIRRLLYIDDADSDPNSYYSKERAAFRYKDKMYTADQNGVFINLGRTGNNSFQRFYGANEILRTQEAKDKLFDFMEVELTRNNSTVQRLLLDFYYDRAVAEMLSAREYLDSARYRKVEGFSGGIDHAVDDFEQAYFKTHTALMGYSELLNNFMDILLKWTPTRGLSSPNYRDSQDKAIPVIADGTDNDGNPKPKLYFTGYKDLSMLYKLMGDTAKHFTEYASLTIINGQSNSALIGTIQNEYLPELKSLLTDLDIKMRTALEAREDQDSLDDISREFSGLATNILSFDAGMEDLDNIESWINGESDLRGFPEEALVIFYNKPEGVHSSFDILNANMTTNLGYLNAATSARERALNTYDTYRYNQSNLASTYKHNYDLLEQRYFELTGREFCKAGEPSCVSLCEQPENGECLVNGFIKDGSILNEHLAAMEVDQLELDKQILRLKNLEKQIEIEIDRVIEGDNIQAKIESVLLEFGDRKASLASEMQLISEGALKGQDVFVGSLAKFASTIGKTVVKDKKTTETQERAKNKSQKELVTAIAIGGAIINTATNIFSKLKSKAAEIEAIKKRAALAAKRERLEALQQATINSLLNQQMGVNSKANIQTWLLEMGSIDLDIHKAIVNRRIKIERMAAYWVELQRLVEKMVALQPDLAEQFYADPVHYQRMTDNLAAAEFTFDRAQETIILATKALEYKWFEDFATDSFNAESVYSALNAQDLVDIATELHEFNFNKNTDVAFSHGLAAKYSLKKHHFGYLRRQRYRSPICLSELPVDGDETSCDLISDRQAFEEQVELAIEVDQFGNETGFLIFPNIDTKKAFSRLVYVAPAFEFRIDEETQEGVACLKSPGTWSNKIEELGVQIDVYDSVEESVPARLSYGESSYARAPTVSDMFDYTYKDDGSIDSIRHVNSILDVPTERMAYQQGTWRTTQPIKSVLIQASTEPSIPATSYVSEFEERPVAASGWHMSVEYGVGLYENFDPLDVDDITIHFKYSRAVQKGYENPMPTCLGVVPRAPTFD